MWEIMMRGLVALLAGLLGFTAQAALIDRGEGFIYDDVLDVTWTQNADINGLDTWDNQLAWAAGYSQTHSVYGTFDDWRLASMDVNGDDTIVDCSSALEIDCRDNEYGYMYYQNGVTNASPSPFTNVDASFYWSGTENASFTSAAWFFLFGNGGQSDGLKSRDRFAWAVRDGDVIPIPAAVWLFASALGVLGWLKRRST